MFAQLINRINRGDASTDEPPTPADAVTPSGPSTRPRTDGPQDDILDAAIDWVDAPLTYFDRHLVLRAANAAYCRLVARQRHEVIGRSLDELLAPEQRIAIRAYFERALSGESLDVDIVHQSGGTLEGASRIEYRSHRDSSGQVAGVFVVLHRLGRRQADQVAFNPAESTLFSATATSVSAPMRVALRIAQDDLIERERKQRELIESLPLPFVFVGNDGLCKWANPAFCESVGTSEDEIAQAPPASLSSSVGKLIEEGLRQSATGSAFCIEEQLALRNDQKRWHRIDFMPGFDRNGFQSGVYVLFADVHESRVAALLLQESESHFRGFTENIPESIVFLDRHYRFRYANKVFLERSRKRREELIGRTMIEAFGDDFFALYHRLIDRVLAGETVTQQQRSGMAEHDWRELRMSPFRGENGQVEGVYIISRSIDEEKRAQLAVAERDDRIHFLTDNVPAQIVYLDTELRYRYCNQRFLADHALTADQVIGHKASEILGDAVVNDVLEFAAAALRGERVQYERPATGAVDESRWLRVSLSGDFDDEGNARGIYSIAHDITDSKAAEDVRARQQQWIESFVENFPQPLGYLDTRGVHVFSNRALSDLFGFEKREIVGHTNGDLLGPDVAYLLEPGFRRALSGERVHAEHELKGSAGRKRDIAFDWLPDVDATGNTRGVYCVVQDISEAKRARTAYEESIREMQRAMDSVALPISFVDTTERLRFVNSTTTTWYGRPAEELIGMPIQDLMSGDDYRFAQPYIHAALAGESVQYEREMRYHDGMRRWVLLRYVPTRDETGTVTGFYTTATDIQSRKKQEIALQQANGLLTAHFENTPLASFTLDGAGRVTRWSSQAETLFGWKRDEVFERPFAELGLVDREMLVDFFPDEDDPNTVEGNTRLHVLDTQRRDRLRVTCEWHIAALRDPSGQITSTLALIQDVSQRVEAERRLTEIAQRDTLTRLLNRNALEPTLRAYIERARQGSTGVAVLFLDLDHFKNINDTLGHRVGDLMLVEIANILRNCVRAEDEVARIGGDEFMIVVAHQKPKTIAHETAQRIITALGTPIRIENQRLSVAASIGIAVYPDHGRAPEALVRSADLAMYRAKENGKNRFEFFSAMLAQRSERHAAVKTALRLALQRDALRLFFQPRVRITDNKVVGAEALLRWEDPRLGMMSPKEFIGIAEESGLIHELGLHVFRQACRQLREWQDRKIPIGVLSINFSAHQLLVASFIDEVDRVIEETGVDPRDIEVEITETSMLFDLGITKNVIADLKHRGMRIAIDDFGTGFSSLSHLQQLDVDTLKIDQSFIRDMLVDKGDAAITTAVISLARGLGLSTTAEGVENEQQLKVLRASGCDYYQGFFFSPAIVVADLENLLLDGN